MLRQLRQTALLAANSSLAAKLLQLASKISVPRQGTLAVLTFHRIDYAQQSPNLYPGLISANPEEFEEHLDLLASLANVVSVREVLESIDGGTNLPVSPVLLTFDDASIDFAKYAWPALQKREMPATLFVPTAFPDCQERRFWWDRLHLAIWQGKSPGLDLPFGQLKLQSASQRHEAFKKIRNHFKQQSHAHACRLVDEICAQQQVGLPPQSVLSWDELRDLAQQGVCLAPHTQTHPLLTRVTLEEARDEIVGSRIDLEREIGDIPPVFAYPGGAWNQSIADILRKEQFKLAFTVQRGVNRLADADPLSLHRINVGQNSTSQILRAQLMAGWCKPGRPGNHGIQRSQPIVDGDKRTRTIFKN